MRMTARDRNWAVAGAVSCVALQIMVGGVLGLVDGARRGFDAARLESELRAEGSGYETWRQAYDSSAARVVALFKACQPRVDTPEPLLKLFNGARDLGVSEGEMAMSNNMLRIVRRYGETGGVSSRMWQELLTLGWNNLHATMTSAEKAEQELERVCGTATSAGR